MQRTALYRKYRSADFEDVVGQAHVTASLQGALKKGLVSHAYLFTGPRGVGKTSVARILARHVNKLDKNADINSQLDIIEIDAASNRGIDEIRALRERISNAPSGAHYKVYIIDEVHMLTREAFNALLKTLEEPPEHAIFILATTEAHKLPETILSRTQRFDFRPITESDINKHLAFIAKKEKLKITPEALTIIARASQGGLRDAISLLDQLSVFDKQIDANLVNEILGLSPKELIDKLLTALVKNDLKAALKDLHVILNGGGDPVLVTEQLIDTLRQKFLDLHDQPAQASAQNEMSPSDIIRFIDAFTQALRDFKLTGQYSLPLELAFYRLSQPKLMTEANQIAEEDVVIPKTAIAKSTKNTSSNKTLPDNWQNLYTKALSYIKTKNNSLYAVMNMADTELLGDKLILRFNFSFHKDRVEEPKNRNLIETVMSRAFGTPIQLECEMSNGQNKKVADPESELVSTAIEILGGEVVDG